MKAAAARRLTAAPASGRMGGAAEIVVNGVAYTILEMMGKGGTSVVFKVVSPEGTTLALKQVRLDGSDEDADQLRVAVENEIELMNLMKRRGLTKYIIDLVDAEVKAEQQVVFMVMECGSTDLAGMLQKKKAEAGGAGYSFKKHWLLDKWEQMLQAVHAIHEARVIHGDLKPANFLDVKGDLKLIDFGIAKAMANPDDTKINRENTVGTVNYMSPEAIFGDESGLKQGRASDVWSLGCILYQMVHGTTPFYHIKNIVQKMQAITNENHAIKFPPTGHRHLEDVMRACLQRKPQKRPSIPALLAHPLLGGEGDAPPAPPAPPTAAGGVGIGLDQLAELLKQVNTAGGTISTEALIAQLAQQQQNGGGGASHRRADTRVVGDPARAPGRRGPCQRCRRCHAGAGRHAGRRRSAKGRATSTGRSGVRSCLCSGRGGACACACECDAPPQGAWGAARVLRGRAAVALCSLAADRARVFGGATHDAVGTADEIVSAAIGSVIVGAASAACRGGAAATHGGSASASSGAAPSAACGPGGGHAPPPSASASAPARPPAALARGFSAVELSQQANRLKKVGSSTENAKKSSGAGSFKTGAHDLASRAQAQIEMKLKQEMAMRRGAMGDDSDDDTGKWD